MSDQKIDNSELRVESKATGEAAAAANRSSSIQVIIVTNFLEDGLNFGKHLSFDEIRAFV